MTPLKRAIELLFILVLFPIAALWVVGIAIAASPTGFFAYLGALLAAWLLFTFVFPLAGGGDDSGRDRRRNQVATPP